MTDSNRMTAQTVEDLSAPTASAAGHPEVVGLGAVRRCLLWVGFAALVAGACGDGTGVAASDEPAARATTTPALDSAATPSPPGERSPAVAPVESPSSPGPPPEIEALVGGVLEQGGGDEFTLVVEFEPDSNWTWLESGNVEYTDVRLDDPTRVRVTAIAAPSLHVSCTGDTDLSGARIEVVPAGPLDPSTNPVSGSGWMTLSCLDLDEARTVWDAAAIGVYTHRYEGVIGGRGAGISVTVDRGQIVDTTGEFPGDFSVVGLFDQIAAATEDGLDVRAEFDPDFGNTTRIVIEAGGETTLDLTLRGFVSADRPSACETSEGSVLDLDAEPAHLVLSGQLFRWTDSDECPVRLDVITHFFGPEHCGWDQAQFLRLGERVGDPIDGASRTFIWDPTGSLDQYNRGAFDETIAAGELPATASDTGYRRGGLELWIDTADPESIFVIDGGIAQRWRRDIGPYFLCA